MLRAFSKVEKHDPDHILQLDNLYHFFQDCWHLKDWIKNDDTLSRSTRKTIVSEAEKTESLNYCADLANGSKHLKLNRPRKRATLWRFDVIQNDSDRSTLTGAKQLADDEARAEKKVIGGEAFITTAHYVVASPQGSPFGSTVGLARRAVQDWKDLLKKHRLTI
jgi:hypothetical protein